MLFFDLVRNNILEFSMNRFVSVDEIAVFHVIADLLGWANPENSVLKDIDSIGKRS